MRVALYARVSTERQEKERTIDSQVDALRSFAHEHSHTIVESYVCLDEGHSGARLDRPALDRLRDGARDGAFEAVLVLCPDRLARKYVYQVLILEELEKWGVQVIFLEQPLTDDPQAHLLLQIQGAVAEYERTKIAERYRRGKLYRARQGEVVAWRVPYGYRRVPRSSGSPARLEIFEPEAAMVRQIFTWHVEEHLSVRELAKRLTLEQVPTPQGRSRYWGTSTLSRILHNQAYIGAWQTNTAQMTRLTGPKIHVRWQTVPRDRQEWITIPVPPIVDTDLFQRSQQIHRDNSRFSPRHLGRPWWLLRCLVWCGECHHSCRCHTMRTRNGTLTRYYHCQSHTSFVSPEQRCGQRHIRADALDAFVWRKVSEVLRDPQVLLQAIAGGGQFLSDDDALTNQLDVVKRQCGQVQKEQQRLLDAYQVELLTLDQLEKRMLPLRARAEALEQEIERLETEQGEARSTRNFRDNVQALCATVSAGLSNLSFYERQEFMRLMVERVEVENWNVKIVFRIPLPGDDSLSTTPSSRPSTAPSTGLVSTDFALRSARDDHYGMMQKAIEQ